LNGPKMHSEAEREVLEVERSRTLHSDRDSFQKAYRFARMVVPPAETLGSAAIAVEKIRWHQGQESLSIRCSGIREQKQSGGIR
jgi:hypothetical protein